ncbi:MAG: hypothetical protein R3190_06380, partial [Thermoanaerobaculia bacterium]|nr:hypothetical protein [Thermoanaerobaculia bacterium]
MLPEIRSGEGRLTLGATLTLFGIMAAHTVLETARDALFLARLPSSHLALVYLLIAVASLVIFAAGRRRPAASSDVGALGAGLVLAAVISGAFWLLHSDERSWLLYGLYVWCGISASLTIAGFWLLASGLFNIQQAKRLFPAVALGGILGATVGAGLGALLAAKLEARDLLLAAAVL